MLGGFIEMNCMRAFGPVLALYKYSTRAQREKVTCPRSHNDDFIITLPTTQHWHGPEDSGAQGGKGAH